MLSSNKNLGYSENRLKYDHTSKFILQRRSQTFTWNLLSKFNYMNVTICRIISYFCAVLFPVDLVTKRAILEVARRASSRLFFFETSTVYKSTFIVIITWCHFTK